MPLRPSAPPVIDFGIEDQDTHDFTESQSGHGQVNSRQPQRWTTDHERDQCRQQRAADEGEEKRNAAVCIVSSAAA